MTRWTRYTRIPFRDEGRNFKGCDCWGLVRLVYRQELGIRLPSYGTIATEDLMNVVRQISKGEKEECWRPVTRPQPFDICVMSINGGSFPGHVGIMTSSKLVLHTEKGTGPVLVPVKDYTVRERIVGFRRYLGYAKHA